MPPDRRAAGERDLVHARIAHQGVGSLVARGKHADDSFWQSRRVKAFREDQRIERRAGRDFQDDAASGRQRGRDLERAQRSEEHTSELQSLMRISYAVFCLKKKTKRTRE